jgi:uncharacterized membrane protein HdeD (DUF308 family)
MSSVSVSIIILIVVQGLHLYEEVKQDFRRKLPVGEMPKGVFVAANVLVFAFAIVTLCMCQAEMMAGFVMAWIFGIGMILNGCIHMGMMIHKRGYFPGGVTAPFVLVVAVSLIHQLSCY